MKIQRGKNEAGQAMVVLVICLALFLLGAMAFCVDMGNLWWHKQTAQNAADAACTAGMMDLLPTAPTPESTANATTSANYYAGKNGYAASTVHVSFPGVGAVAGIRSCDSSTPPPITCEASGVASPYIKVNIDDPVQLYFAGMLGMGTLKHVGAYAICGQVYSNSPVPILILNPTGNGTLHGNGNHASINIVGGPQRSIQVNSNSGSAISMSGNPHIDLHLGGPDPGNGSDLAVVGASGAGTSNLNLGTRPGKFIPSTSPINDPYALIVSPVAQPAPVRPADLTPAQCPAIPCHVVVPIHGCQDATNGCELYTPGTYNTDPVTFKKVLLFDPGLYYMNANLSFDAHTCIRPGIGAGNDNSGTTLYFHGNHTISVGANGGDFGVCGSNILIPVSQIRCTAASEVPPNIVAPGGIGGMVLLGPCAGPYGDPLGTDDPIGEQRGIVLFQDRSAAGITASFGASSAFGLVGGAYFHFCGAGFGDGTTAPVASCSNAAYTDDFGLQGGNGVGSFVVGNFTVDKMDLGGNPNVTMDLNATAAYYTVRASLLQ
ncbi:MAG: TadE/TadG family type IV pilus assembly protein [Terriglobales bacterium]